MGTSLLTCLGVSCTTFHLVVSTRGYDTFVLDTYCIIIEANPSRCKLYYLYHYLSKRNLAYLRKMRRMGEIFGL